MESNSFFSFSRFLLLMRNDILLNYKKYLLTIIGAFILGFIFLFFSMPDMIDTSRNYTFDESRYFQIFVMCLFGLGAFVGSAFSELSSKVNISNYMLIPASSFEKFLSQFVIRALFGTAIFLFIFWADAHIARFIALSRLVDINKQLIGPENYKFITEFDYSMLFKIRNYNGVVYRQLGESLAMILGIFSIGMYLFSVKLFFKRMALVKTIISLAAVIYLILYISILFSHIFYPETKGMDFHLNYYKVYHNYKNMDVWLYTMFSIPWLFLLPMGYFKLKEKQV